MCCFSRNVEHVWSTRIFARPLEGDRQLLVYEMSLDAPRDLAMILPIPVPPGSGDGAVRFVNLSSRAGFFDDLETLFPVLVPQALSFGGGAPVPRAAPLVVHDVGDFEASFVPTPRDFDRLDSRFRLPGEVWDALPSYADWGFCVFKLRGHGGRDRSGNRSGLFGLFRSKAKVAAEQAAAPREPSGGRKVHPMAFEFPRRDPSALFFPTVHVHDGFVHPTAMFDHALYCQTTPDLEPLMDWTRSSSTARVLEGVRPWVDPGAWLYKRTLRGELPNRDTTLAESKLRARTVVEGPFRVRMRAVWEQVVDDGKTELDPKVKKWMRVSEASRSRVRDAIVGELAPVFATHAREWNLAPFSHDLPRASELAVPDLGACLATFEASSDRIEPQELDVAFASAPPRSVLASVQRVFQDALDHAAR